jgi:hypothetical protein
LAQHKKKDAEAPAKLPGGSKRVEVLWWNRKRGYFGCAWERLLARCPPKPEVLEMHPLFRTKLPSEHKNYTQSRGVSPMWIGETRLENERGAAQRHNVAEGD